MFIEVNENVIINRNHVVSLKGGHLTLTGGESIDLKEEEIQAVKDGLFQTKKARSLNPDEATKKLFVELHKLTGGEGNATLTLERERKLKALINKHRMTPDLLKRAAENIGKDPFLQGSNERGKRYGNIDYLLRPDKAAMWSEESKTKQRSMF